MEGVLTFAWIFQVLAIGVNLGGYLIHPMAVKMPGSEHTFQHVLGTRRDWAVGLSNVLNLLFRIGLYYPLYVLYYVMYGVAIVLFYVICVLVAVIIASPIISIAAICFAIVASCFVVCAIGYLIFGIFYCLYRCIRWVCD